MRMARALSSGSSDRGWEAAKRRGGGGGGDDPEFIAVAAAADIPSGRTEPGHGPGLAWCGRSPG